MSRFLDANSHPARPREGGDPAQVKLDSRLRGDERMMWLCAALLALSILVCTGPVIAAEKKLNIGRAATADEVAGWDIDIRPDGHGLPKGKGTVKDGEALYVERCAACHGEFGEGAGRWPILAGGNGTLASHDPVKSVGSYWPYATTLLDYIRRAMPFGASQTLTNDELYAITAYVLFLNDIVTKEDFELNDKSILAIKLPNQGNFFDDDRDVAEKAFWKKNPCMTDCAKGSPQIIGRARAIDVTPEGDKSVSAD
jgi:mono/diheme cytochrome c family protein